MQMTAKWCIASRVQPYGITRIPITSTRVTFGSASIKELAMTPEIVMGSAFLVTSTEEELKPNTLPTSSGSMG
jgi:hypothetical protein